MSILSITIKRITFKRRLGLAFKLNNYRKWLKKGKYNFKKMTKHWLTCLNLTLVAQPEVFKQRGRGNQLSKGGNTRALVGVDHSGNTVGPSTSKTIVYTSKDQSVMPDVDMEGNNFDNYDEID